ncbi:hypothetical protein OUZ56_021836 [Daphnia magna]|uniref:Uncharacterized protein n=1 Tax=Daphnia magna TaxID=35525 RepID=A0ABR0AUM4_9CRUS|nr:hypothetical protein OUZ56_021836 [Daphnia magna]
MDLVTNDSFSVTQEEDSSMSPQPLIVDESQEVTDKSVSVRAATDEEIIVAGTSEEWKIRPEVLAEENSSLKDKVKLLEEALLVQKAASDDLFFLLTKYLHFQKITSLESERERLANLLSVVKVVSGLLDTFPSATREIHVLDLVDIIICFENYKLKQALNTDLPRRQQKRIQ